MGIIGDIAGAVGSIFGIGSSNTNRKKQQGREDQLYQRQLQDAYNWDNTKLQRMVNDAKAAGLHPLAVLGQQSNAGPSGIVGGGATQDYTGNYVAQMGQSLGNAVDGILDMESRSLDNEIKRAQLDQIRNMGQYPSARSQAGINNNAPISEMPFHSANSANNGNIVGMQAVTGYNKKASNAYQVMRLPDGAFARSPSEDLPDLYSEGLASVPVTASLYSKMSYEEVGDILNRMTKEGSFNPATHDVVQVLTPFGMALKPVPKGEKGSLDKIKEWKDKAIDKASRYIKKMFSQ